MKKKRKKEINLQEAHWVLSLQQRHGVQHHPINTPNTSFMTCELVGNVVKFSSKQKGNGTMYLLSIQSWCAIFAISARNTLMRDIIVLKTG